MTVTLVACEVVPPAPIQVNVYAVFIDGITTSLPVTVFIPLQPPEPVHEVAFVDDQSSVDDCPAVMLVGVEVIVTVGIGVVGVGVGTGTGRGTGALPPTTTVADSVDI